MMTFHNSHYSGKLSMSQRAKSFHPITQSNVIDMDSALRQRLDELATIRFCLDASVENDNKTCVGFFTDQPTEPLLKFENRLRKLELPKPGRKMLVIHKVALPQWGALRVYLRTESALRPYLSSNAPLSSVGFTPFLFDVSLPFRAFLVAVLGKINPDPKVL